VRETAIIDMPMSPLGGGDLLAVIDDLFPDPDSTPRRSLGTGKPELIPHPDRDSVLISIAPTDNGFEIWFFRRHVNHPAADSEATSESN
jgi:hypothetical protein